MNSAPNQSLLQLTQRGGTVQFSAVSIQCRVMCRLENVRKKERMLERNSDSGFKLKGHEIKNCRYKCDADSFRV